MKKFNKKIVTTLVIASFMFGFVGLNYAHAVTPPSLGLGAADGYSVFGKAGITTTGVTHVWGNAGADSSVGLISSQVGGSIYTGSGVAGVAIDASSTYDSLMSGTQGTPTILDLAGTHTTANGNPITPGVYNIQSSTMNGDVELSGDGVYIFRSTSSITNATAAAHMTLTHGACASKVFWAIPTTMTIGTGANIEGTIIAQTGSITIATGATLVGRAISLTGNVTLDANQITQPICGAPATLNVIKHVSGGTASAGDWTLTVASTNSGSGTGSAVGGTGTSYTLETGHQYSVTENAGSSGYTPSSSSDCTIANAVAGTNYTCTITNTYIVRNTSSGSSVMPIFNPTINIIGTPIIPKLPKTGFAPQENSIWYESLLNSFLNLFR